MNVVGESCYEDIRATPLNRVNILVRNSKIFVAKNNEQTITGLTPLMNVVGESCYEDIRATPLNYHFYST